MNEANSLVSIPRYILHHGYYTVSLPGARCKSKTGRHNQDRSRCARRNQSQTHSDATGLNCGNRSWICNAPLISDVCLENNGEEQFLQHLYPVYTIQLVVKPVWQPAVSCKQTSNRLSNQFCRVNGALDFCDFLAFCFSLILFMYSLHILGLFLLCLCIMVFSFREFGCQCQWISAKLRLPAGSSHKWPGYRVRH